MNDLKFSRAAFLLIAVINLYFLITVRAGDHQGTNWQTIIYSDGKGYYEYLRAAFVNHNLIRENPALGFMRKAGQKPVIKYFAGPALAYSPFFFAAKLISLFTDQITDGYTYWFQIMIALAGWCYCLLGLFFTMKLLKMFTIADGNIAICLLLITYGTNLFYYAVLEPAMSHVYSFACVAGFVFYAYKYLDYHRIKHLTLASIFFGLTILIRPTNAIVLLMLPFMVRKEAWSFLLKNFYQLLLPVIIVCTFIFLQMLLWHIQTGSWIVYSYTGEGFYFTRPAIAGVLLSYDKGWFVYTPLAFISLVGFIPLWKVNRRFAISIAITLMGAIYFTAAWWCWDYANSFGMRPMIDFYSILAIPLAIFISSLIKNLWKLLIAGVLISVLAVSIIQTYQYYQNILQHYGMNKEKFWFVFLKTDDSYRNILGGNVDLMPYTKKTPLLIQQTDNSFETEANGWKELNTAEDPFNQQNHCFRFDSESTSLTYSISADSSIQNADMLYIQMSLKRMELSSHSSSAAVVIAELQNEGNSIYHYQFLLNDFPDNNAMKWRTFQYAFWMRKPMTPFKKMNLQILNPERKSFLVDDVQIKVFRIFQQ